MFVLCSPVTRINATESSFHFGWGLIHGIVWNGTQRKREAADAIWTLTTKYWTKQGSRPEAGNAVSRGTAAQMIPCHWCFLLQTIEFWPSLTKVIFRHDWCAARWNYIAADRKWRSGGEKVTEDYIGFVCPMYGEHLAIQQANWLKDKIQSVLYRGTSADSLQVISKICDFA